MRAYDVTVQDFIGGLNRAFIIPPYQRNYAWGEDQCRELYEDIIRCVETGSNHYIGNVVYYLGENDSGSFREMILVDGQQRITTILLLLCAIRDISDDNNLKNAINEQYLCNRGGGENHRIRLKQTVADGESFTAVIDKRDVRETACNVSKNYHFFRKKLFDHAGELTAVFNAVARLQLVEVNLQVPSDSTNRLVTVQTIFEKINSTGKPLSQADLIRNFLLITSTNEEQNRWHRNYWLRIEENLGVDNISAFARDFLRMTECEEIRETDIYREFKDFVLNDMNGDQEKVLGTLLKFSKSYAWLINCNSPNAELNRELRMLRNLKSNDFAPLVLCIMDKLRECALSELRRIIHLIADYLLRMRIASPTTGSSTTRSLSFELIRKMQDGTVNCNYNDILYELSNSPTVSGEFPSDDKFAAALQGTFYYFYARELLLRVEEYETRNIPVDISRVTVEHLMPQTISEWWEKNLGGKAEAERIRLACTNTVGNFAIVSQEYNSSMSNKPWPEKREALKDVQFTVTSSAAEAMVWDEKAIIERGKDLANRAIKAVTSPLQRTRSYRTRKGSESGLYPLLQGDDSLTGTELRAVIYNDERRECATWSRLLSVVGEFLYVENPSLFAEAVSNSGWYSKDRSAFRRPAQVADTPWFCCGGGHSGRDFRTAAANVAEKMGRLERFQLEVVNPAEE
jgi:uncharacterized protein with ParB-like and HNH nuclease domain